MKNLKKNLLKSLKRNLKLKRNSLSQFHLKNLREFTKTMSSFRSLSNGEEREMSR
jgi:hypothetical protein